MSSSLGSAAGSVVDASRARLRAEGEPAGDGLVVDPPADLAGQRGTTRSATDGVCRPSPQCGVTRLRWRSSDRVAAPRCTSSHHRSLQLPPRPLAASSGSARRSARRPRRCARRRRGSGRGSRRRRPAAASTGIDSIAGPGGEQRGDVDVGAAVHADRGHRLAPPPSRSTAGRSPGRGRSGSPGCISSPNHGSSSHDDLRRARQRRRRRRRRSPRGAARTARTATANARVGRDAGAGQRDAERDRARRTATSPGRGSSRAAAVGEERRAGRRRRRGRGR